MSSTDKLNLSEMEQSQAVDSAKLCQLCTDVFQPTRQPNIESGLIMHQPFHNRPWQLLRDVKQPIECSFCSFLMANISMNSPKSQGPIAEAATPPPAKDPLILFSIRRHKLSDLEEDEDVDHSVTETPSYIISVFKNEHRSLPFADTPKIGLFTLVLHAIEGMSSCQLKILEF